MEEADSKPTLCKTIGTINKYKIIIKVKNRLGPLGEHTFDLGEHYGNLLTTEIEHSIVIEQISVQSETIEGEEKITLYPCSFIQPTQPLGKIGQIESLCKIDKDGL